jgi:hypothetical protein
MKPNMRGWFSSLGWTFAAGWQESRSCGQLLFDSARVRGTPNSSSEERLDVIVKRTGGLLAWDVWGAFASVLAAVAGLVGAAISMR